MSYFLIFFAILGVIAVAVRLLIDKASTPEISTKSVEESRAQKIWGQVRLLLVAVLGFMAAQGVIDADSTGISNVLDSITTLITSVEGILAVGGFILTSIGDWFTKEKQ